MIEDDQDTEPVPSEPDIPQEPTYQDHGRRFALKHWPWPSPGWFIGPSAEVEIEDEDEDEDQLAPTSARDLTEEELLMEKAKRELDGRKRAEFQNFVRFDLGLSDDVWMTKRFRSEVIILQPTLSRSDQCFFSFLVGRVLFEVTLCHS